MHVSECVGAIRYTVEHADDDLNTYNLGTRATTNRSWSRNDTDPDRIAPIADRPPSILINFLIGIAYVFVAADTVLDGSLPTGDAGPAPDRGPSRYSDGSGRQGDPPRHCERTRCPCRRRRAPKTCWTCDLKFRYH